MTNSLNKLPLLVVLAGCLCVLAQEYQSRGFVDPPGYYRYLKIDGHDYIKGTVYLDTHADTALLKPFGFLDLSFRSRGFRCVKYDALWPREVELDSLPRQVSGVEYDPVHASQPNIFIFFGWRGPECRINILEPSFSCFRAGRFRYAVPKSGAGDYFIDGRSYVSGRVYVYEDSDTTQLADLGFRELRKLGDMGGEIQIWPAPDGELERPEICVFRCKYPASLDVSLLPPSVIELGSDSVAIRYGGKVMTAVHNYSNVAP